MEQRKQMMFIKTTIRTAHKEKKKEKEKVYADRRVWEASDRPWRPFSAHKDCKDSDRDANDDCKDSDRQRQFSWCKQCS